MDTWPRLDIEAMKRFKHLMWAVRTLIWLNQKGIQGRAKAEIVKEIERAGTEGASTKGT